MNAIVALTGLELECTDLKKSADWYVELFGLQINSSGNGQAGLKGGGHLAEQLTLKEGEYNQLTGLVFEVDPSEDLQRFARSLGDNGVRSSPVSEASLEIQDPDGTVVTFAKTANWRQEDTVARFNRPLHMSHVVLNSPDPERLVRFYVNVLGFHVSDKYERGLLTLLRCEQPQHHCIGIAPAAYSGLNHFAMECGSIDAVMNGIGRMKRAGIEPLWGPGRHGPGGNVFCYFEDPNGLVAEFTCELLAIPANERWEPKEWARTPENANVWGTGGASPRAMKLMNDSPPRAVGGHRALPDRP
jgi:catechol 2,3-dioxygenase-like lactoylglutathione lyase family enzyme